MAFEERNAAYDISLFEAAEQIEIEEPKKQIHRRRKNNVLSIPEEQLDKIRRRKYNPAKLFTGFMLGMIVTGAVVMIVHGQVQLTELNQQISNAASELGRSGKPVYAVADEGGVQAFPICGRGVCIRRVGDVQSRQLSKRVHKSFTGG